MRALLLFAVAACSSVAACSGGDESNPAGGAGMAGSGGTSASGGTGGTAAQGGMEDPDPDPMFTDEELTALKTLAVAELPAPPDDKTNEFADNPDAATLGQRLFFDPGFSGELLDGDNNQQDYDNGFTVGVKGDTGKAACASCHIPDAGFVDTRTIRQQISLASGWGKRRAPSILDVGQSKIIMWDGRHDDLYNQVFGPLESEVEWNSSRLYAVKRIFTEYKADYEALFGALPPLDDALRFPDLLATETGCRKLDEYNKCEAGIMRGAPGDGAEYDGMAAADQDAVTRVWVNVGKSIAAYERLLSCGTSRFDAWALGDDSALDRAEQRGAALFAGKGKCITCHNGAFFSDEQFHNVGLQPATVATVFLDANDPGASEGLKAAKADPLNVEGIFSDGDDGRLPAKLGDELVGAFRTPKLRCISEQPSFMHTGQFTTLEDTVAFFGHGGDMYGYPGTNELENVGLTVRERTDLVAFLKALQGDGPDASLLSEP